MLLRVLVPAHPGVPRLRAVNGGCKTCYCCFMSRDIATDTSRCSVVGRSLTWMYHCII